MNLKNLLNDFTDAEIVVEILEKSLGEKIDLSKYYDVLENLRNLEEQPSSLVLLLVPQQDIFEDEENMHVEVFGYDKKENIKYALDFTPWSKWLGMEIVDGSLKIFSKLDILVYSIFEMTVFGFDETVIQNEVEKLNEISDKIQSGEEKTYSFEEVIAHLREKIDGFEYIPPTKEEREMQNEKICKIQKKNDDIIAKIINEKVKNNG